MVVGAIARGTNRLNQCAASLGSKPSGTAEAKIAVFACPGTKLMLQVQMSWPPEPTGDGLDGMFGGTSTPGVGNEAFIWTAIDVALPLQV